MSGGDAAARIVAMVLLDGTGAGLIFTDRAHGGALVWLLVVMLMVTEGLAHQVAKSSGRRK